ncbi:hypothetical protein Oweho_2747 [Owenweeksia hongkongensis DSM 17368]|uniref:Uncharacterized protein n=1 Tax=Owenweeksia hongkongensis (strain DSM 17368 / CIP 108786 / JCM 12287 / NRRL B-23963 / UST20020801) TaxID=926562 RepID=G8R043_OWEHD|nr:hypothetical protein [Owenweeksia hongkongensis]AEV33709.1 hypothetical protein Oweho_2747 [Owenweeksia hongkongensis DSM 17368]
MNSSVSHKVSSKTEVSVNEEQDRKLIFWETVNIVFKTTGVVTWFCILLLTVLEVKRYFNIDFIPGYNSAVDDVYNAVRAAIF